jgi:hypothetical protein
VILAATTEADKREKLMLKVVDVLLKYVKRWSITPSLAGADDTAFMLNLALTAVGCGEADAALTPLSSAIVSGDAKATSSLGLRYETFAAFMVLHLIGRPTGVSHNSPADVSAQDNTIYSTALWQWVVTSVANAQQHGQPSQAIALGALSRLAGGTYQRSLKSASSPAQAQCGDFVRNLLSPTSPNSALRALIVSASQAHPRTSEDGTSAQWGSGIEHVLQAATFLKNVAPRRFNGLISDKGFYSTRFRKEDAALYMALAQSNLLCNTANGA